MDSDDAIVLPQGWIWSTLGELSDKIGSGITPRGGRTNYATEGVAFIRSQNVRMLELDLSDVEYISEKLDNEMSRTKLQYGDVLLNITGASIGRVAWFNKKGFRANVNQHVCIIRLSYPIHDWITLFLASPSGQDQIMKMQTGVTRQGLNYRQIANIRVPLPPLSEQRRIVAKINELFTQIDECIMALKQIEAILEYGDPKKFSGGKLRDAILKLAFEGKLVPQDPNDEPVSFLLERIKAERCKSKNKQTSIV